MATYSLSDSQLTPRSGARRALELLYPATRSLGNGATFRQTAAAALESCESADETRELVKALSCLCERGSWVALTEGADERSMWILDGKGGWEFFFLPDIPSKDLE